ncbi:MAG: hypothetical protein ACYCW6_29025 [Candidatus Xenobia bacterium]
MQQQCEALLHQASSYLDRLKLIQVRLEILEGQLPQDPLSRTRFHRLKMRLRYGMVEVESQLPALEAELRATASPADVVEEGDDALSLLANSVEKSLRNRLTVDEYDQLKETLQGNSIQTRDAAWRAVSAHLAARYDDVLPGPPPKVAKSKPGGREALLWEIINLLNAMDDRKMVDETRRSLLTLDRRSINPLKRLRETLLDRINRRPQVPSAAPVPSAEGKAEVPVVSPPPEDAPLTHIGSVALPALEPLEEKVLMMLMRFGTVPESTLARESRRAPGAAAQLQSKLLGAGLEVVEIVTNGHERAYRYRGDRVDL